MPSFQTSALRRAGTLCPLLMAVYFLMRLPHLRDLPAFTDETTYARWTQLILADPVHHLFVSMSDAKPPLHYWLLALTRWFARDPIMAGRLLSVFVGALSIPAIFLLCRELTRLEKSSVERSLPLACVASVLMITSPLMAMQQRMALAEPLLLLQAIVMAWLSLRLARHVAGEFARGRLLRDAAALGMVWAGSLLTKQIFSYLLWGLPVLGLLAYGRRGFWRRSLGRCALPFALATIIGLALFVPVIFTDNSSALSTRLFYKPVFHPSSGVNHLAIVWNQVLKLFWPMADGRTHWWPHDPLHPLDQGILYLYLTPPVLLAGICGVVWMLRCREWRLFFFLGGWCGMMLGVLLLGATKIFSRFTTVGGFVWLLAAAWILVRLLQALPGRIAQPARMPLWTATCAAVLAWPMWSVAQAAGNWLAPMYARQDAEEYVTAFGGGKASEDAIVWLKEQAQRQPLTVITGSWIGTPNDLIWLLLRDDPNVRLYWNDDSKTLWHPLDDSTHTYMLGEERWEDRADKRIALDPSRPAYFLLPLIYDRQSMVVDSFLPVNKLPAGCEMVGCFLNPVEPFEGLPVLELAVFSMPLKIADKALGK